MLSYLSLSLIFHTLFSIDGEITYESQMNLIRASFDEVSNASDVVLCEGTGHCAVGSIVNVNNAKVASMLGASMLLIANGGLGEFSVVARSGDDFGHLFYAVSRDVVR